MEHWWGTWNPYQVIFHANHLSLRHGIKGGGGAGWAGPLSNHRSSMECSRLCGRGKVKIKGSLRRDSNDDWAQGVDGMVCQPKRGRAKNQEIRVSTEIQQLNWEVPRPLGPSFLRVSACHWAPEMFLKCQSPEGQMWGVLKRSFQRGVHRIEICVYAWLYFPLRDLT